MSNRTVTYERYLKRVGPLVGITYADLSDDDKELFNSFFNRSIRQIWEASPWPEISPVEARTPSSNLIAWDQSGEVEIEAVFAIYDSDPTGTTASDILAYDIKPTGVYLVGADQTSDDVYVWFRKRVPDYYGDTYSASTTYEIGDQVYYSTTGDYYKCLQQSTGQAPTETAYWERLTVPHRFLDFCVYASYADWLRQDDQHAKAEGIERMANDILLREQDKLERQEGYIRSPVVNTHQSTFDNT